MFRSAILDRAYAKPGKSSPFLRESEHEAFIQPKLKVEKPNDKYDVGADAIADNSVQRAEEEEVLQTKSERSTKGHPHIEKTLNSSKGGGNPLSNSVKSEMETGFGTDFGKVNIHTDAKAIQMNKQLNAQAFTHGNDIYFNQGKYNPSSSQGKHLLAHELTHTVQQGAVNTSVQRKLTVEDEYPQGHITEVGERSGAGKLIGEDPSKALSNQDRLDLVKTQLGKLTPHFEVKGSGEVRPTSEKTKSENELAKDAKATASCCLNVLTRKKSTNDWQILITDHLFPHTDDSRHKIIINSNKSPFELGFHNKAGEKVSYKSHPERVLGHELCGHAAMQEIDAHAEGKRAVTNVHDSTINIENEIAKESLGLTDEKLQRGHAGDGPHKGESFGHSQVIDFEFNKSEIDKKGKEKLKLISDMVRIFDLFVEIRGHSDNVGSEKAKQDISDARSFRVLKFLTDLGVSDKASVNVGAPGENNVIKVKRFLRKGMSDKEPRKENGAVVEQKDLRRVDVIVASFPAGLSKIRADIPKSQKVELAKFDDVKEPPKVKGLRKGTPCEQLLVEKAFPKP
ncbi:eCIS core domain-containing protein [Hwangdonia seohaensis]|uniref:DUF4157 domain-containing protein n=1 Tax=Hwangdonia seohaensis TaxID=1240727 RepID=A0ABW3RFD8_9FLAO|nr:DUF4157 domain-containing protein [Hwangdonia seohaensis]